MFLPISGLSDSSPAQRIYITSLRLTRSIFLRRARTGTPYALAFLFMTASGAVAQSATPKTEGSVPIHLVEARQLVRDLSSGALINQYGTRPTFLRWGQPTKEARTVCATFVTRLLEHSYGFKKDEVERWVGGNGAEASQWHDVIEKENGFAKLETVNEIEPGDIIAIKYSDGSKDTGHVMVVDGKPEKVGPTEPIEPGTEQFRLEVIDSTSRGHGPTDNRHRAQGGFSGGIGEGFIRLYAAPDGHLKGYTWSEMPNSKYFQSPARDLVIGRLKPGFKF